MTKRKGQKDKQLSTKQFNEKKLNWVQTIDLNLLTYGSDDKKKISISLNTLSILLNLQRDSL
jgi:hypothetical protein